METPKRIIVVCILFALGSLSQIGGGIFTIAGGALIAKMDPNSTGSISTLQYAQSGISILFGILFIPVIVFLAKAKETARKAAMGLLVAEFLIVGTLSGILTYQTINNAQVPIEGMVAQLGAGIAIGFSVFFYIAKLGMYGWALFSAKATQYFNSAVAASETPEIPSSDMNPGQQ